MCHIKDGKVVTPTKQRRVAIYARVSKADKDDPNSIPIQLADCREYAESHGLDVIAEYVDEGRSGWDPKVIRRQYEQMLAELEAGKLDSPLARDTERLLRQDKEGARWLELYEAGKVRHLLFADEAELDLTRARDRKDFKERVASAVYYSDRLSEKIRSSLRRKRENGDWKGGGTRPFGYQIVGPKPYRVEKDETEAALIVQAAKDFLRGRGLRGIAADWNARGIRTATGKLWTGTRLGDTLRSAHLAGRTDEGGPAGIPAILDELTSRDVRTLLNDPERKKYSAPRVRRHFLTGIIRCARCGTKMTAHPNYHGTRTYICRKGYDGTGCGRMRIKADPVEELVGSDLYGYWEMSIAYGENPDVPAEVPAPTDREAIEELRALRARLEELGRDYYADGILSRDEYLAAKREVDAKVADAESRIHVSLPRQQPDRVTWAEAFAVEPQTWDEAVKDPGFVEWHAELAHRYLDRVLIHPATKPGPRFDPSRVEIVWRKS